MLLPAVLFALEAAACVVPAAEVEAQTALAYAEFDARRGAYGWRALNDKGCTDAAVALLSAYLDARQAGLSAAQRREASFHIGQALAFAGRDGEALAHFERAQSDQAPAEWQHYVAATIAFLRRDAEGLAAARRAYAAVAPRSMRLRIIDGFVACPNEAYAKAAHCAP